jgi:hypothetical protein
MPAVSARAAVAFFLACALACAGNPATSPSVDGDANLTVRAEVERACDEALARVDEWIARRDADPAFPRDALAEARALRDAAVERFAAGDLNLALELLQSAESLLEGSGE